MISFCEKLIAIAKDAEEPISEVTYLALLRLFETLGEAASKVSSKTRDVHPEIPWVDAIDTRNRFIHGYDDLDYSTVWRTIKEDIPPLLEQLIQLSS
jgi:uncharacterized protein with HEPN domain